MAIFDRFLSSALVLIITVGCAPPSNADSDYLWDYTDIKYGTDAPSRQWLNIHLADTDSSAQPAPVYLYAHGAGESANDMTENQVHTLASKGYTTVSWNSLPSIDSGADLSVTWSDAQQAFDWVQANAATYNFDPDHIVIGGVSRGSGASWELAHSGHTAIKGIYMVNALPNGFWQDTESWSPADNVTVNSPPSYLVYGPTPEDNTPHSPTFVAPVVDRYEALDMGDKITLLDGMWDEFQDDNGNWTNDGETMHYFHRFVDSLNLKVSRTTDQITHEDSRTLTFNGKSLKLDFYRNNAYSCGVEGYHTFFVMSPVNETEPDFEAPLWAYLHGGGFGWYDEDHVYNTVNSMTYITWNDEETFQQLIDQQLKVQTMNNQGDLMDSTMTRRIQDGYRLLVTSMCDHDLHSGRGAPDLNNPHLPNGNAPQVNGLQAAMSAVDFTSDTYATNQVIAHGTSAGSIGVFNMAQAYVEEGIYLTAVVADSWSTTSRAADTFDNFAGVDGYPFNGGDLRVDGLRKLGFDSEALLNPVTKINNGFTEVPTMFIIGEKDPACAGTRYGLLPMQEAIDAGLGNCAWQYQLLGEAVDNQPNSPHVFDLTPEGDHVDTKRPGPVNDRVDIFLDGVLETAPAYVFPPASQ